MPELDSDACAEILMDIIEEQGEVVFTNYANVGPPLFPEGACVRKFRGKYWTDTRHAEGEFCGPYDTLREAFDDDGDEGMLLAIVDAGELVVKCTEMSAPEVAGFLNVVCDEADINVEINGENWVPSGDGNLIRDPNEIGSSEFVKRAKLVLSRSDKEASNATTKIFRYGAGLWVQNGDAELTGLYAEIEDAVSEADMQTVDGPAVFASKELSAGEIAELLQGTDTDEPIPFTINGQQWAVRRDGEIRRSRNPRNPRRSRSR